MVTTAQKLTRTAQDVVAARVQRREQAAQQRRIQVQIQAQVAEQARITEAQRKAAIEASKPQQFRVFFIDKATRTRPQLKTIVFVGSKAEAEARLKGFFEDRALRETPKGLEPVPKGPEPREARSGRIIVGPVDPSAGRGRQLERERLKLERIAEKPISELTVSERSFIKKVTGKTVKTLQKEKISEKRVVVPVRAAKPVRQITTGFITRVPTGPTETVQTLALTRTGRPVTLKTKDVLTGELIKTTFDTTGQPTTTKILGGFGEVAPTILSPKELERRIRIEKLALRLEEKRRASALGFERVEKVASILTLGRGRLISERSFIGQTAQTLALFPLSVIPAAIVEPPLAAQSAALQVATLLGPRTRETAKAEIKRAFGETKTVLEEVTDIKKPAGVATLIVPLIAPLPRAVSALGKTIREVKFEAGIKKLERGIVDPSITFTTKPIFEPTGRKEIVIGPRGIEKTIIEVEGQRPGFLTFGEAGEITGRQTQLVPRDVPAAEAQAQFAPPRLGTEVIRGRLPEAESLVKFVERPLSPRQQAIIQDPFIVSKKVKAEQVFFRRVFPPSKKGAAQLGGVIPLESPFRKFERAGGEFFERIKVPQREPIQAVRSAISKRRKGKLLAIGATVLGGREAVGLVIERKTSIFFEEDPISIPKQRVRAELKLRQKQIQDQAERLLVTPKLITAQRTEAFSFLALEKPLKVTPTPRKRPKRAPRTPPPLFPTRKSRLQERVEILLDKLSPSYDVQLRRGEKRGSKFVTIAKNLPQNRALRRGRNAADNFIEASFRLKPNKKQPKQADLPFVPDLSKFRRPRKGTRLPKNTIIEKANKRLDTFGERQQLSFFKAKAAKSSLFKRRAL